jgi:adenylylsulfate kinase
MGLPGSGKTTLSCKLAKMFGAKLLNADEVRAEFNDWDFSIEGRIRQARRMRQLADEHPVVIADFVCPLPEMRDIFSADYTIWMDTIESGRYEDTNALFVPPERYNIRIKDYENIELENSFFIKWGESCLRSGFKRPSLSPLKWMVCGT